MKVLATSDLHGQLPKIDPCDLLIIAGDICPLDNHDRNYQYTWLNTTFSEWAYDTPAEEIILIAGNHDFELMDYRTARNLPVPNLTYLKDSIHVWNGIRFYGIPWVPNLPRWAFYATDEAMYAAYDAIPLDTDVLITHGPPLHVGDKSSPRFGSMHCGHPAVNSAVQRVSPRLTINGHIHEGHGLHWHAGLPVWNVSYLDDYYKPIYKVEDVTEYVLR